MANLLLVAGDVVLEQDQVDSILDGLSKEYYLLLCKCMGTIEPLTLYDVEAHLYVQEVQLEKFWQELVVSTMTANVANANDQTGGVRGRGRFSRGTKCQLCGKYGQDVMDRWHGFDKAFTSTQTQAKLAELPGAFVECYMLT